MCFPGGGTHNTRNMCFLVGGTDITRDMCFPGRRTQSSRICFSQVAEHITLGRYVSLVGEHITLGIPYVFPR